jgi:hypothetical protein
VSGQCDIIIGGPPFSDDGIGSEDDVWTGPKFGCIHHEPN